MIMPMTHYVAQQSEIIMTAGNIGSAIFGYSDETGIYAFFEIEEAPAFGSISSNETLGGIIHGLFNYSGSNVLIVSEDTGVLESLVVDDVYYELDGPVQTNSPGVLGYNVNVTGWLFLGGLSYSIGLVAAENYTIVSLVDKGGGESAFISEAAAIHFGGSAAGWILTDTTTPGGGSFDVLASTGVYVSSDTSTLSSITIDGVSHGLTFDSVDGAFHVYTFTGMAPTLYQEVPYQIEVFT